jgi:hypothetical protein
MYVKAERLQSGWEGLDISQLVPMPQVFFLDHDKNCYKSDLKIIEQSGLLRSVRPRASRLV